MPNQPKTPHRAFRCPDDLWHAAQHEADMRGDTMTDVLLRALDAYLREGVPPRAH